MNNQPYLIAALAAALSLATAASAQTTLYLNSAQASTNNALTTASSWWTDAAGTTTFTGTLSTTTNILAFNNLVPGAFSGRTGGGTGGSISISGFQVLNPGGAITVTTANNSNQTITLNGAVGIDMGSATEDFTYTAGSATDPTRPAFLRIATAAPATTSWSVNTGRTLTIGSATRNTNGVPNTSVTAQSAGKTLQLRGNGTTAMGNVVFHANVGSNSLALQIDGTGTSSSGGNVAFNGTTNSLGSLSITNARATFASGGTTTGAVTVNSTGTLAGSGTLNGATSIDGTLRTNTAPINDTARLTFGSTLLLGATANTIFDIDGANYTGVTLTSANSLTYGGGLAFNFVNGVTIGSYDLFNFTAAAPGSFSSVSVTSFGALSPNAGVWSGTYGGFDFAFTESTGDLLVALSVIPEPSAFAVLAGIVGLGFAASRRRRAA